MNWPVLRAILGCVLLAVAGVWPSSTTAQATPAGDLKLVFRCAPDNDLYRVVTGNGIACPRYAEAVEAARAAPAGAGVLVLADGYPQKTTQIGDELIDLVAKKKLRLYVEYPQALPGLNIGKPRHTRWERAVVTSDAFGPTLKRFRILAVHDCHFVPVEVDAAHLVVARVAGFDTAVYALDDTEKWPILFEHSRGNMLVATTKLSQFVTARYAPTDAWGPIWKMVLGWLQSGRPVPELKWEPAVRPSFAAADKLPDDVELQAIRRGTRWLFNARMLIHPSWLGMYDRKAAKPIPRAGPAERIKLPIGDGSEGVLEGLESNILSNGTQTARWLRRSDCNGETAGAMALASHALHDEKCKLVSRNIGDFLCLRSIMSQGKRADPSHPAFGLIGWHDRPGASPDRHGYGIFYGVVNARGMLGLLAAATVLENDAWDERIMQCLLGNLRTTGRFGIRHGRLSQALLEKKGWRHFFEEPLVDYATYFHSHVWAAYLWAYHHTGSKLFLDRTKTAIRMTMAAYPNEWRWLNGLQQERARMLLPLAWLVRVEDTPEHRRWLRFMTDEMLAHQVACGAIREELGSLGKGIYGPPRSNKAYGTTETPLIQKNGDPACDLLYTCNFALLGLHEAAAATGDPFYRRAEDRLARFLCRIQVRSPARPELDGVWFRAFDFDRWEYWASNGDAGWGVWCAETGWTQGWIITVLALRQLNTSLWDLTANSKIGRHFEKNRRMMIPDRVLANQKPASK